MANDWNYVPVEPNIWDPKRTWTYEVNGVVKALYGFSFMHERCVQAWIITNFNGDLGLGLTKWLRRFIPETMEREDLYRTQCLVFPIQQHIRWIELLGFEPESVLRQAGPSGEDMIMYRMLRG